MGAVEQFEEMRAAFEHWFSDEGVSPRAIERDMNGNYRLQQAASAWTAWKAAWQAARTSGVGAAPRYRCVKCGYTGPQQINHQRPNGTGECGYIAHVADGVKGLDDAQR